MRDQFPAQPGNTDTAEKGRQLLEALCQPKGKCNTELCLRLIAEGANVNVHDDNGGDTALIHAVCGGYKDVVLALLKQGADVDARGSDQHTALLFTASAGHTDIARILIEHGANMEAKNLFDNNPLMIAARHGHTNLCRMLIAQGANTTTKNWLGKTAYDMAEEEKKEETALVLYELITKKEFSKADAKGTLHKRKIKRRPP
ncbi:MAG: ankyrin repeat domain-containing protein [Alphaproteobacteria bacterium]|nr:ankyrin repeat domain-containing protein [Alphaproteobacteria bacterium]